MSELYDRMARLADQAADDTTAQRMLGQVAPMVARVRRRRAARRTGMSLAAVGTAAAVSFGVMVVGGHADPAPLPPASSTRDAAARCGEAFAPGPADEPDIHLLAGLVGPVDAPDLNTDLVNLSDRSAVIDTGATFDLVALRDGVVAATAQVDGALGGTFEPLTRTRSSGIVASLQTCTGDPLTDGEYSVAISTDARVDGSVVRLGDELATVTITDGQVRRPDAGQRMAALESELTAHAGEAALSRVAAIRGAVFPACGSRIPSSSPGSDPALAATLAVDSHLGHRDGPLDGSATLVATGGRTVLANVPVSGARLVVAKDGVVVATPDRPAGDVELRQIGPEGSATALAATGTTAMCDGQYRGPLPEGTYQAYGVVTVTMKEIQGADGTATAASDTRTVVSAPVAVSVP